jgi:tetratricopeptide (TPR) repeat protein
MAIEGPLKELNIQDVLQLLSLANKTGVLTVRSDRLNDEAIVHFSKGDIVFAVRRRSTRRIGQMLIRAGKLTQRELNAALEVQRSDPTRRLAEILLDLGNIAEQELERQLRFQMEETIYELMSWEEGYFTFEERTEIALHPLLATVRVESLLMEGARRVDEWTRLEAKVPGPESVPVLAPAEARDAVPLELRTEEWEVLAEVDGERDIRQLAADLARSAFDVAKTVYALVNAGIVRVHDRSSPFPEEQLRASIAQADALLASGALEEAQKLAVELEALYPDRSELALLVGRTLVAESRLRAATEAFSRAVALDPLSAEAHYLLGLAALQTGDFDRAAKAWDTYVRLSPNGDQRERVLGALAAVKTLTHFVHRSKSRES